MANRCTEVLESPKAQLMADDGLVAPAPRRSWDWSSTIELLARANEGQLLQVEVPDGVPAQHVQSNLRQIAFRRGFSIKSRHMDGVL